MHLAELFELPIIKDGIVKAGEEAVNLFVEGEFLDPKGTLGSNHNLSGGEVCNLGVDNGQTKLLGL